MKSKKMWIISSSILFVALASILIYLGLIGFFGPKKPDSDSSAEQIAELVIELADTKTKLKETEGKLKAKTYELNEALKNSEADAVTIENLTKEVEMLHAEKVELEEQIKIIQNATESKLINISSLPLNYVGNDVNVYKLKNGVLFNAYNHVGFGLWYFDFDSNSFENKFENDGTISVIEFEDRLLCSASYNNRVTNRFVVDKNTAEVTNLEFSIANGYNEVTEYGAIYENNTSAEIYDLATNSIISIYSEAPSSSYYFVLKDSLCKRGVVLQGAPEGVIYFDFITKEQKLLDISPDYYTSRVLETGYVFMYTSSSVIKYFDIDTMELMDIDLSVPEGASLSNFGNAGISQLYFQYRTSENNVFFLFNIQDKTYTSFSIEGSINYVYFTENILIYRTSANGLICYDLTSHETTDLSNKVSSCTNGTIIEKHEDLLFISFNYSTNFKLFVLNEKTKNISCLGEIKNKESFRILYLNFDKKVMLIEQLNKYDGYECFVVDIDTFIQKANLIPSNKDGFVVNEINDEIIYFSNNLGYVFNIESKTFDFKYFLYSQVL